MRAFSLRRRGRERDEEREPTGGRVRTRPPARVLLLFLLPALLLYTTFIVYPLFSALQYSLFRWEGTKQVEFAGLDNFVRLFTEYPMSERLPRAFWHNCLFFAGTMLIQNTVGLTFAMLLRRSRRGRRFLQTAYTLPHLVSPIVVGYLWSMMLNPQFGALKAALTWIDERVDPLVAGGVPIEQLVLPWTGDADLALPTVIAVNAWQWVGFPMLLFGAALAGIPPEYEDAARVDGASAWQSFRKVTLPLLTPAIGIVSVLTFVGNFNVLDVIYAMETSRGNPAGATDVLGLLFYRTAFESPDLNKIGQSSALAVVMFLLIFGVSLIVVRMFRRMEARLK